MLHLLLGGVTGQTPLYRSNYGVVLEPVGSINPIKEYWTHMVKVNLPSVAHIPSGKPVLEHCKTANSPGVNCEVLSDIVENLVELRNNTAKMLRETTSKIRSLIPEAVKPQPMSRTRRSLLPFLGDLANSLIGVATEADVANLAEHINVLENRTKLTGQLFAKHSERMISFMDNTDERINKAINSIKNNHDYIQSVADTVVNEVHHTVELLARAMKTLAGYVKMSTFIQFELEQLETGINEIVHGKLSSSILSPEIAHHIMSHISQRLALHYPDLALASPDIEHVYQTTEIVLTRHENTIYMMLKFPLKSVSMGIATLYEIISMPMPVPNNPSKATKLVNLPAYVAVTENRKFYAPLKEKDITACSGTKVKVCSNPLPFKSSSQPSCILSLVSGNMLDIKQYCNFTFVLEKVEPYIVKISTGQIIVSDSNDISMQCYTGSRVLPGCPHCIYDVPCSCSIQTRTIYIPPSVVNCKETVSSSAPLHTVNLAVLQQFFDESALSNITADMTYSAPIDVQIPEIKVYNHELSHLLSFDREQHLNLKDVAQAAKNDEWAYRSLAEPILTGRLLPKRSTSFGPEVIISYIAMALSCVLSAGIIYLFFKMNRLGAIVTTLSTIPKSISATMIPPLVYTLPPTDSTSVLTNVWYVFYQNYLFTTLLLLLVLILTFMVLKRKFDHKPSTTAITLDLVNALDCVSLPVQQLPFCPEHWQFVATSLTVSVTITGYLRPKAHYDWQDVYLQDTLTTQPLDLVTVANISPWSAYRARKILDGKYSIYPVMKHNGYAFFLGLTAETNETNQYPLPTTDGRNVQEIMVPNENDEIIEVDEEACSVTVHA